MKEGSQKKERGDASGLKVGIAVASFNGEITGALLAAAEKELHEWKVRPANIFVARVAGSFELPFACDQLIRKKQVDAALALGCIIKGETTHDEYIAHAIFQALQSVMLECKKPIGLGILTLNSSEQARSRIEYGAAAAAAALGSALL